MQPKTNRILLTGGAMAGPLFTIAWFLQGLTRAGYDPMRHAISSLSVGELGWIQIATFIVTGLFVVALAVALWRSYRGPSGSSWGPLLIGLAGIGLIGSGIFVTDAFNGYPSGSPVIATERTTHGILHDLFGVPFFLGLPIACIVFARYFSRHGKRGWAWYSLLSGIGMFAVFFVARLGFRLLPAYPDLAANFGLLQRVTVTIGFAWLTLLS
ncbi:MAG: DUF998 domain-containing protein, partial [Chloroflexota bacterium]